MRAGGVCDVTTARTSTRPIVTVISGAGAATGWRFVVTTGAGGSTGATDTVAGLAIVEAVGG